MLEPERQSRPRTARDPQALSSEYHKARKQLMLWSGILFIWSLVGIDLETAKDAGGNIGTLIKSIKSPQAIPWALVIMVAYFVFKTRIEWRQCNEGRRQVREARQDYYSACLFAAAACLLYLGQALSRVQFADLLLNSSRLRSVVAGTVLGVAAFFTASFAILLYMGETQFIVRKFVSVSAEVIVFLFIFFISLRQGLEFGFTLLGIFIGVILLLFTTLVIRSLSGTRSSQDESKA